MREKEFYFISKAITAQIEQLLNQFSSSQGINTGEELYNKLVELLPIQKMSSDSVKRRVEGLFYTTQVLWNHCVDKTKASRQEVVKLAKLKPLSHYHWITGSREAKDIVMTRDDYLNDPPTALVKLKDDVIGLAELYRSHK